MKKYLLFVAGFLMVMYVNAQNMQLQVLLKAGACLPVGNFHKANLETGSFTLTGLEGGVELRALSGRFIAGLESGISMNPVDVGMLGYEKVHADPFLKDLYIRSEAFRVIRLLAAPGYRYQVSKRITAEGQALAGLFMSATPYQLYKADYYMVAPAMYEITSARDNSFAYGAQCRLIWESNPYFQLGVSAQYLHSEAAFSFIRNGETRVDKRNISQINTSINLILRLWEPKH